MRIQASCKDSTASSKKPSEVQPGTVFRYGNLTCGPYLKVLSGFVNLALSKYHPDSVVTVFDGYVELPNVTLVTGESAG